MVITQKLAKWLTNRADFCGGTHWYEGKAEWKEHREDGFISKTKPKYLN